MRRGAIAAADSLFPLATAGRRPLSRRGEVGRYDRAACSFCVSMYMGNKINVGIISWIYQSYFTFALLGRVQAALLGSAAHFPRPNDRVRTSYLWR